MRLLKIVLLILLPVCCFTQDSITVSIASEYTKVSKSYMKFFGKNYRKLWAMPVRMRVFHLDQEKGGMTIISRGGGMQTKSLRLRDASGKEWVLRTIQKDPGLALPENLRKTVAKAIVQDQISAAHPFGALVVPPLAAALGVPHNNPQVVYLPDDPALKEHRALFANQVYLFEERQPEEIAETDNTDKVLQQLQKDNDNRVDQRLFLKARLLDMIIGDWDRHEDQWRWVKTKDKTGLFYQPLPRDRDQVFFTNEGIIPTIASRKWILPKFQGFDPGFRDIEGFNFNARYVDRRFLSGLDEKDWKEVISEVQKTLTDKLFRDAVQRMPAFAFEESGEAIIKKLITRRNVLMKEGLKYYRFLSKDVDIPASDKRETFDIQYKKDKSVAVTVYDQKQDGSRGKRVYERSFDSKVTDEIRLYGQDGADYFVVTGEHRSPIRLRMIGGNGNDSFKIADRHCITIYDRSDKKNRLPSNARIRTSKDSTVNDYNYRAFKYDVFMPLASIAFNLDDGIILGAGFIYTKHGFRKEPFAARHRLMAGHSLTTNAFFGSYDGIFTHLIGKNDLVVNLNARAPNNTSNFFGIGNETSFIKQGKPPVRFYRSRYNFIDAQVKLSRRFSKYWSANLGLAGQFYNSHASDNTDRFLNTYQFENPNEQVFETKVFAGGVAGLELKTHGDSLLPTSGVQWNTFITAARQINKEEDSYGQIATALSFYITPTRNFTIANRIGGGHTIGKPAFFQQLYLGGNRNLRGFRNFRFGGESMAYHNLELRFKLFDFTSYLFPGTVGLTAFNDVGRVWAKHEDSNKWHHGYGGGFYLVPSKLVLVQALVGASTEGVLPYVSIGFTF